MSETLTVIFHSGWTFAGTLLLIAHVTISICMIVERIGEARR